MAAAALIAHQGAWDEILLVVGPILIVVALLRLAKKRVRAGAPPSVPGPGPTTITAEHSSE